jgi:hypothetical protein
VPARTAVLGLIAVLAAGLALSVAPAGGATSSTHHKTFAGIIPDIPTGGHVRRSPLARAANLPYGGGTVMHSNRTHLIFWQPAGSGLGYEPGYVAAIQTFLRRVAADSRKPTNVYSLSGQYHDATGPAAYDSQYAGSTLDTDRLPRNGCTEPPTGPGWGVCVNDSQMLGEIEHMIGVHRLPTTARDLYLLVSPKGMGSCTGPGPDNCALGGEADGSYCGYHSESPDDTVLYAIIPYNAVDGHCQSGSPRPNGGSADPTISTVSHEHNEAVTDPYGTAWIDLSTGNEDGDLCISNFGPTLGGSGSRQWNESIGGGHYFLQEEWSNADRGCAARTRGDQISFSAPARVPARRNAGFVGRGSTPHGSIRAWDWFFGDGKSAHKRVVSHAFPRAGRYRVVLRTTDAWGIRAFFAKVITVTPAPR